MACPSLPSGGATRNAATPPGHRLGFVARYHFERSTLLAADTATVWAHALSMTGVNKELFPLARMTYPAGAEKIRPNRRLLGKRLFRSWILAFGMLPIDYDDITIVELDDGHRFLERSPMFSQREWSHERTVTPAGQGSLISDRVSFTPRIRLFGPLQHLVFRFAFWLRHRNLIHLFGSPKPEGN